MSPIRRAPGPSLWGDELVANADFCEDVVGVGWIGLDFAAQPVDVHLEQVAFAHVFVAPDVLQQQVLRHDAAGVLRQIGQ